MFNGSCSAAYNIGAEAFAAARSGSAWRKATTMELSTSVGSSGVAAAGFYQAWFDAELRRNNCSFVTISDQVFLAPRPFFLAPGCHLGANFFASLCVSRITVLT